MTLEKPVLIKGPAGTLELLVSGLEEAPASGVGIVCHPHPLHQGTMMNKVVTTLVRAWQPYFATVRFNFRGVGQSEGTFNDGVGELADLQAVIAWVQKQAPAAPLFLAGFSFGAYMTAKAAQSLPSVAGLISVAPAIHLFNFLELQPLTCPWLIVQGAEDEWISVEQVALMVEQLSQTSRMPIELKVLPKATHFFHGCLNELKDIVKEFTEKKR